MKKFLSTMIVMTLFISLLFTSTAQNSYTVDSSTILWAGINLDSSGTAKTLNESGGLELFYTVTVEKDNPTFHVSLRIGDL